MSEPFFDEVLTNDEKQELIYSVKTGNEALFLKCARLISDSNTNADITVPDTIKANAPKHLSDRHNKDISHKPAEKVKIKTTSELWWSWACAIAAGVTLKFSGLLPSLLFILVSGVFLIRFFLNRRTKKDRKGNEEKELSNVRRMILFSDTEEGIKPQADNDFQTVPTGHSRSVTPLFTGMLTSSVLKDGKPLSYSLMMDRTTIGSDVFLSDIVLDDPSVDALHAIIYLNGNSFYISDCSKKGTTYIDDRKVALGRRCEIKNGQKITVGTIDFRFEVLLPSAERAWTSESQIRNAQ